MDDSIHNTPLMDVLLSNEGWGVPAIKEDFSCPTLTIAEDCKINHVSVGEEDAHELDFLFEKVAERMTSSVN
jgi:hypothetical protein